jgi:Domain of unknown function (DUF5666)
MNRTYIYFSTSLLLLFGALSPAQTPDAPPPSQDQTQAAPPAGNRGPGSGGRMEGRGTVGKIASMTADSVVITKPDGTSVTVKLTDKTEFRKDRQPAKLADFKVGDFVMVRGDENSDHSVTAQLLGGRSGNGGPGGARGGQSFGELGKDYVAGEVKAIDAPKLTVLRPDNITQTVELTEDTTLRKGRDSITMADIQAGEHVVVRGALQNNVFVPKAVMVLSPEQWQRMQQYAQSAGAPAGSAPAAAPENNSPHP